MAPGFEVLELHGPVSRTCCLTSWVPVVIFELHKQILAIRRFVCPTSDANETVMHVDLVLLFVPAQRRQLHTALAPFVGQGKRTGCRLMGSLPQLSRGCLRLIMWSPDYKTPPKKNNSGHAIIMAGGGAASLIFSCLRGPGSKLFGGRGSQ